MASKRAGVPITTAVRVSALALAAVRAVSITALAIGTITMAVVTMPIFIPAMPVAVAVVMRIMSFVPMIAMVAVMTPVTVVTVVVMSVIGIAVIGISKSAVKTPVRPAIARRNVIWLLIAVIITGLGVDDRRIFIHRRSLRVDRWRLIYRLRLLVTDGWLRILRGHRSVSRLDGSVHQFTAAIDPRDDYFIRHFVLVE